MRADAVRTVVMEGAAAGVYRGSRGDGGLAWPVHAAVHVGAILVLALAATVRFHPYILSQQPRTDERVYLSAFRAVSAGESPYAATLDDLGFYYPPAFAALGAAALEATGERTVVAALRVVNLAGLACCLWCAALFLPLGWRWGLAVGVLYVASSPVALHHGLRAGNLSFAVSGATLVALAVWRRRPLPAGVLLALSAITKPIAPVGMVTLAAHRPRSGGRRHLLAAGTGIALAGAAALISPHLLDYLAQDGDVESWPLSRSVSLYRWLHLAGLPVPPVVFVPLVALSAAWLARRQPIDSRRFYVLAIAAMTLATPALWSHTLLLTLPLPVMALGRAWRRLRSRGSGSRLVVYEVAFVVLAVLALQLADGIGGGLEVAATPFQLIGLVVPVVASPGLAAYVWNAEERSAGGDEPPTRRP